MYNTEQPFLFLSLQQLQTPNQNTCTYEQCMNVFNKEQLLPNEQVEKATKTYITYSLKHCTRYKFLMWVKAQSQTTVHSTHYFSFTMMIAITIIIIFFILYSVPVYDSEAVFTDPLFLCINFISNDEIPCMWGTSP